MPTNVLSKALVINNVQIPTDLLVAIALPVIARLDNGATQ